MPDTLAGMRRFIPNPPYEVPGGILELAPFGDVNWKVVSATGFDVGTLSSRIIYGFYFVYGSVTFPDHGGGAAGYGYASGFVIKKPQDPPLPPLGEPQSYQPVGLYGWEGGYRGYRNFAFTSNDYGNGNYNAQQVGKYPPPPITLTVHGQTVGVLQSQDTVFFSDLFTTVPTKPHSPSAVNFGCLQRFISGSTQTDDFWSVPEIYFAYYELGAAPPPPSGTGPTGGGAPGEKGVDLLSTRTGLYIARGTGGVVVLRAPTAFQPGFVTTAVDNDTNCRLPHLLFQQEGSGIVVVYRKGTGHKADPTVPGDTDNPYFWTRRTSYDLGRTWAQEKDKSGKEAALKSGAKWLKQLNNRRTRETLIFYNDGSGMSVPPGSTDGKLKPDGTGLLMADIYDVTGALLGTFPKDGKGILGAKSDDAAFDVEFVADASQDIRLVFLSGGSVKYAITCNEGRDWKDITSQMGS